VRECGRGRDRHRREQGLRESTSHDVHLTVS
jgi:hypothetical protein